jgi:arsenite oxidase small subunit
MSHDHIHPGGERACVSRRQMLILGGAGFGVVSALGPIEAFAQGAQLVGSRYPARVIGKLSQLAADKPVDFTYPNRNVTNVLVRLGERAGGGIGPGQDIVAFNAVCPHMGGPVDASTYKAKHKVLGPCPLHLSTFDLTRHGMIVSGHSTQSLAQVMLELRGDDIVAVGFMGLVWGYASNPRA